MESSAEVELQSNTNSGDKGEKGDPEELEKMRNKEAAEEEENETESSDESNDEEPEKDDKKKEAKEPQKEKKEVKEEKKESKVPEPTPASRNPKPFWMNLKGRFAKKKDQNEKKEKKEVWIPRVWGWGGLVDFAIGIKIIFVGNPVTLLCLTIPFAFASNYAWSPTATFVLCMLAIIPLAKLMGEATEELALRVGQTIGGLLNATFGNAVELIVSIIALTQNLPRVVQSSLLGSILSNVLLVMGMSFFVGGLKHKIQYFNKTGAQTSSSLLTLAVAAILFPAALVLSNGILEDVHDKILVLSRITAIVMLLVYLTYLFFQLKTHSFMFGETKRPEEIKNIAEDGIKRKEMVESSLHFTSSVVGLNEDTFNKINEDEDEDEEETPRLSVWGAIVLLAVVTVLVAILAEYLVSSIQAVTETWGISQTFVGIVLLPIVGNAAEHVTAVTVAYKDKMDLSIGVALGSGIQISLLVIPFLVILGWIIGKDLNLYFLGFETSVLFITVIVVGGVISDGESNYLEGLLLMAMYFIIAAGFYFHDQDMTI